MFESVWYVSHCVYSILLCTFIMYLRSSLCCKSGREYELYFAAIERKEEYR